MPRHSAGEITTPSSVDDNDTLAPKSYVDQRNTNILAAVAANPEAIATGTITRSETGAATNFNVTWPDNATGTFTGTESIDFPGAIDSYTVTHVLDGDTITFTQPTLTRDVNGAVATRPAITTT